MRSGVRGSWMALGDSRKEYGRSDCEAADVPVGWAALGILDNSTQPKITQAERQGDMIIPWRKRLQELRGARCTLCALVADVARESCSLR